MLEDHATPPTTPLPEGEPVERAGITYSAAHWTPEALTALTDQLATDGREALEALPTAHLLAVWQETVAAFLDPGSPERRALAPVLPTLCRLSPEGLDAGLAAVLGGVGGEAVEGLLEQAEATRRRGRRPEPGAVLVLLASNLPALAVQPLLPALALRRPVLLKSPSSEPLFTPAFARALAHREPALGRAVAAVTWPGGRRALEAPLLTRAGRVLAYGEAETLAALEARAPGKVVGYGPKTSLALVGGGVAPETVAAALARDVALFDQRGCPSIAAVYTAGAPQPLAEALAAELGALAGRWPPGPATAAEAAAVRQVREEADLRGLVRPDLPFRTGTVVVDPELAFRPTPGRRTVRIHPVAELGEVPAELAPWHGRLQGAALAGEEAEVLAEALGELGVSRLAPPGALQSPDALWHNGGLHPLEALGG